MCLKYEPSSEPIHMYAYRRGHGAAAGGGASFVCIGLSKANETRGDGEWHPFHNSTGYEPFFFNLEPEGRPLFFNLEPEGQRSNSL